MEQEPNYSSYVKTINELDSLGIKKSIINWQSSSLDLSSFEKSINLIKSNILFDDNYKSFPENIQKYWDQAALDTQSHHIGTTRMGKKLETSVVNENLKVHGIKNLFISGSSVFPTSGISNPTLTLIALSLKLSDYLKKL